MAELISVMARSAFLNGLQRKLKFFSQFSGYPACIGLALSLWFPSDTHPILWPEGACLASAIRGLSCGSSGQRDLTPVLHRPVEPATPSGLSSYSAANRPGAFAWDDILRRTISM